MFNFFLILLGRSIVLVSKFFNLGNGSTWPGHIALSINKNFIRDVLRNSKVKIILIAGTNGKTTTAKLIRTILEYDKKSLPAHWRVFQNAAGANLLNGIASSLVLHSTVVCKLNYDYAIFEIDENTLPLILHEINNPDFIIILNLFRDQLDRYGEVNTIAKKWEDAIRHLLSKTTLILNADDPQVAFLGEKSKSNVLYFGINPANKTEKNQHASDSNYCPNCGERLIYNSIYFSHLGDWICKNCGFEHPKKTFTQSPFYPLSGTYNEYNTNAAVLLAKLNNVSNRAIEQSLRVFKPAFGRQEILKINDKKVQIFLSKNPASFNESLKTIANLNANNLLLVLNDRIPDGRDVSWIWDVDFEDFSSQFKNITVTGDRAFDLGLRLKYAEFKNFQTKKNLAEATNVALEKTLKNETLYILPTYSAMLEVRKILTGKSIL
ncbi:MAG: hypothetical protein A3H17_04165 [Candidatus Levybacteria bacterium RIFCSPLOWO2_12_FULL_37_14]|nr:MAG: hypothetical protein US43_C0010G0010 [Candidatus Levybacteria bacterium GW2011_GWA1_37_16]KKQ42064.1 MAG: hypothetical protein US59_C0016G0010 [Candidatus Levybacteria bacterium GW2011_GWB1_37_8]OGH50225.1 MAG: hypothetical protein A3H17_04165 [Candidatus Levybacteria bacterium RIFCSPLOWO2_12_FULL_37_14]